MKTSYKKMGALCLLLVTGSWLLPDNAFASVIATLLSTKRAFVSIETEIKGLARKSAGTGGLGTLKYERSGAGIIIDASGIIVTNGHTVGFSHDIRVTLHDGTTLPAEIAYQVKGTDIAFIRITPPYELTAVSFTNPDLLRLHSTVYSLGHSMFLNGTLLEGKITALGKSKKRKDREQGHVQLLLINFKVYPGDSGSPLLDKKGRLMGLTAAGQTSGRHQTYAIPSTVIERHFREYLRGMQSAA